MSPLDKAVSKIMLDAALNLNEAGDLNAEYARGQANLIADVCGMADMTEAVYRVITRQTRLRDLINKIEAMP